MSKCISQMREWILFYDHIITCTNVLYENVNVVFYSINFSVIQADGLLIDVLCSIDFQGQTGVWLHVLLLASGHSPQLFDGHVRECDGHTQDSCEKAFVARFLDLYEDYLKNLNLCFIVFLNTWIFQYMFGALRDCVPRMTVVKHKSSPRELLDAYDREIYGYLKEVGSCQEQFAHNCVEEYMYGVNMDIKFYISNLGAGVTILPLVENI